MKDDQSRWGASSGGSSIQRRLRRKPRRALAVLVHKLVSPPAL